MNRYFFICCVQNDTINDYLYHFDWNLPPDRRQFPNVETSFIVLFWLLHAKLCHDLFSCY
jgi:hypothetical protein